MRRYRLTISGAVALVGLAAAALAAMKMADPGVASAAYSLAILAALSAALGAAFAREDLQAFCAGFATFCGTYLLMVFGPWSSASSSPPLVAADSLTAVRAGVADIRTPIVTGRWLEALFNAQDRGRRRLQAGAKVEVIWNNVYYPSTVIEVGDPDVKIHYDGYPVSNDEWVDPARIERQGGSREPFLHVGHSLAGLILGAIGGGIAILFRRSRREVGSAS